MIGTSCGRASEGGPAARLPPWLICRKSTAFRLAKRRRRAASSPGDLQKRRGKGARLSGNRGAGRRFTHYLRRSLAAASEQNGAGSPAVLLSSRALARADEARSATGRSPVRTVSGQSSAGSRGDQARTGGGVHAR